MEGNWNWNLSPKILVLLILWPDYRVLGGVQNGTHTAIRFARKWDTCDEEGDARLGEDTVRVIWAFDDVDGVEYHGANRGTRSVHLKEPAKKKMPSGDDVKIWDIRAHNHILPNHTDTYYGCQIVKVPFLRKKHHLIAFEPLFQPGHESYLHHFILYECFARPESGQKSRDLFEGFVRSKETGNCADKLSMPSEWNMCRSILAGWAVGSEGFVYPDDVGVPLCERFGGATYFKLEIHYDNPRLHQGVVDSSGIRIYYTDKLRPNEGGVMAFGNPPKNVIVVPPRQENYIQSAICTNQCTDYVSKPNNKLQYNGLRL